MSIVSGKCDFADHLFSRVGPDFSELDAFNAFKKSTGGVIYQTIRVELTRYGAEREAQINKYFEIIPPSKKGGHKKYKYYGTVFSSLKSLNNRGYYKEVEIHFETLLDLVKYFPYLVSMSCYYDGKQRVEISDEAFPEEELKDNLRYGYDSSTMRRIYDRQLANEYYRIGKLYDKHLMGFENAEDAKLWYQINYGDKE